MSKRVSLKGKGADIYTNPEEPKDQQASIPSLQHTSVTIPLTKATFYLPSDEVEALDNFWMSLRKKSKNKKISKSLIVSQLINKAFHDLRGESEDKILEILRLQ